MPARAHQQSSGSSSQTCISPGGAVEVRLSGGAGRPSSAAPSVALALSRWNSPRFSCSPPAVQVASHPAAPALGQGASGGGRGEGRAPNGAPAGQISGASSSSQREPSLPYSWMHGEDPPPKAAHAQPVNGAATDHPSRSCQHRHLVERSVLGAKPGGLGPARDGGGPAQPPGGVRPAAPCRTHKLRRVLGANPEACSGMRCVLGTECHYGAMMTCRRGRSSRGSCHLRRRVGGVICSISRSVAPTGI
ncbi:hypothetical protein PCL_00203 [Purpureocillium lilacinum]|uniref:Uncharacterized protein n=1 Tax=Purpureocillium lilacinum TaxID=33203 RepID=A0A2U3E6G0_PURLI|nr:hypothetical protein PCL_00203 [Purpureocillium lilacinum]